MPDLDPSTAPDAATAPAAPAPGPTQNDLGPLVELEADLAAVDAALTSLDRIDLEGRTGDAAVAEIHAVVDPARFERPAPGAAASDLVGDGLVDEQVDPGADGPGPA